MEKLEYTRSVFLEALRLNPPVWIQSRAAVEDVKLGGFRIPKDATILLSAHVTHRLSEYWDDAERFDPNRFMNDLHRKHHRYAYYPFGGGGHRCLGEWFALMEGVLVIAAISQRFNIRYVDTPSLNPVLSMTNQPDPNATVVIEDLRTEA